jgi:malate synthase
MEDAATAEISRAQVWQWIHHPRGVLADGRKVTVELVRGMIPEELGKIRALWGDKLFSSGKFPLAGQIFEDLVTRADFVQFLTLSAYEYLE